MLGTMVAQDPEAPEPRMVVVPKASLEVTDTWYVAGLAGTGSKDVACQDVFVPAHMTLSSPEVRGGPTPGSGINPSPLYTPPVAALFPHLIAAPILGAAPLAGIALAVTLGGERPNAGVLLGGALIIGGITFLLTDRNRVIR